LCLWLHLPCVYGCIVFLHNKVTSACFPSGAVLQAIQLVPALPTRLLPMLVQNIPHKLRDRNSQCLFLRAVLLLAEGKVSRWLAFLCGSGAAAVSVCGVQVGISLP
jgi:hypothetical protein